MFHAKTALALIDTARAAAEAKFAGATGGKNADKVCVVALDLSSPPTVHALFSGAPGYQELTTLVAAGGDRSKAQQTITAKITEFLQREEGGSFTLEQINKHGFDRHGRGAMNCAEPKMYYLLKHQLNQTLRNWVLIPFNVGPDGQLVYNAPCMNCRRWVYRHFHALSGLIAQSQKGPEAFDNGGA